MPTYFLAAEPSSIPIPPFEGGTFDMLTTTSADSAIPITPPPFGGQVTIGFSTPHGPTAPNRLPNNNSWEDAGTQSLKHNVDVADADIDVECRVVKLDSAGTVIETGAFTTAVDCSVSRTLSPVAPTWAGAEDCGNLIAMELRYTNNATEEGHAVLLAVGAAADAVVTDITENSGCTNPIKGAIAGTGAFVGVLSALAQTSGSIEGSSTLSGDICSRISISGSIEGLSTFSGILSATASIDGSIEGLSTFSGDICARIGVQGSIEGSSTLGGDICARVSITGSIEGDSTFTGKIRIGGTRHRIITFISGVTTEIESESGITTTIILLSKIEKVEFESGLS